MNFIDNWDSICITIVIYLPMMNDKQISSNILLWKNIYQHVLSSEMKTYYYYYYCHLIAIILLSNIIDWFVDNFEWIYYYNVVIISGNRTILLCFKTCYGKTICSSAVLQKHFFSPSVLLLKYNENEFCIFKIIPDFQCHLFNKWFLIQFSAEVMNHNLSYKNSLIIS